MNHTVKPDVTFPELFAVTYGNQWIAGPFFCIEDAQAHAANLDVRIAANGNNNKED